jgi:hypothetical protein
MKQTANRSKSERSRKIAAFFAKLGAKIAAFRARVIE